MDERPGPQSRVSRARGAARPAGEGGIMSRRDGEPGGGEADLLRDPRLLPPREERGCPPGESWSALVDGTIAAAERETLLDHLASCPDCAIEVRTLRELKAWSRELAGEAPTLAPPRVS